MKKSSVTENSEQQDFRSTATIENLKRRAEVIYYLHNFFQSRGYFHVETPILSHDIVVDRHLEPMSLANQSKPMWLQTSPEYSMKRLLAGGADSIYQIGKVFRRGELGRNHNPEFTMLEWYKVGQTYTEAMRFLAELIEHCLDLPATEILTYQELFENRIGLNPHEVEVDQLRTKAIERNLDINSFEESSDRDSWLNLFLSQAIEPTLGVGRPMIVCDWPASQAALAQIRNDEFAVSERFEIYVEGVELANGYHELLDADELLTRNQKVNQQRLDDGNQSLPNESRLLQAMRAGLPNCCGVALGVDRLVMLRLGVDSIRDVIAFPFDVA